MKPYFQATGFTLILLSSAISLPSSLASASAAADDPKMADCEPRSCGNGVDISYPFWLDGQQPPYCGFPEFRLNCSHNAPLLSMPHNQYLVRSIFYHNQSLLVSNSEFFDAPSDCPPNLQNLAFSLTPFNVSSKDMDLVFLTNCTQVPPDHYRVTCANGSHDTFAYLAAAGYREQEHLGSPGACESTIMVVPVLGYPGATGGDYRELLEGGFLLNWAAADCSECSASSGRCGYDGAKDRFMCICPDRTHDISCKQRNVWKIALGVGVGGATLIAACFLCCFWFWCKKRRQSSATSNLLGQSASSDLSSIKDTEFGSINCHTHIFSYGELQEATNSFDASRELGDGGFGTVYKGKLRDGRIVAIKRLYENNCRRVEQFMNEVEILSRLHHPNLVNLYGCTSRHSRELLLVYEFVPNGTVADHLHGPQVDKGALSWHVRLRIAIETADALAYLHSAEHQIIHRDVKTNNILLDDNFHVKVADFGLSRLFPIDVTHVSTLPQGTPGYVDPDYHMCYQLTDKSDVYSFGVVLVELISSKPAVDISRQRHEVNLAYMAISMIQNRQLEQLVDPGLGYSTDGETERMITLVAELAFMCLQGEKEMRPSIKEVLEELRRIQSGGCKAEKGAEADIQTREDVQLLKNTTPFSPDSVTGRWESRLTTPNTSE